MNRNSRSHNGRGQAMIETVVIMPVFLTLLLGTVYFGEVTFFATKCQQAARFSAWHRNQTAAGAAMTQAGIQAIVTDPTWGSGSGQAGYAFRGQDAGYDPLKRLQGTRTYSNFAPSSGNRTYSGSEINTSVVNSGQPTYAGETGEVNEAASLLSNWSTNYKVTFKGSFAAGGILRKMMLTGSTFGTATTSTALSTGEADIAATYFSTVLLRNENYSGHNSRQPFYSGSWSTHPSQALGAVPGWLDAYATETYMWKNPR